MDLRGPVADQDPPAGTAAYRGIVSVRVETLDALDILSATARTSGSLRFRFGQGMSKNLAVSLGDLEIASAFWSARDAVGGVTALEGATITTTGQRMNPGVRIQIRRLLGIRHRTPKLGGITRHLQNPVSILEYRDAGTAEHHQQLDGDAVGLDGIAERTARGYTE